MTTANVMTGSYVLNAAGVREFDEASQLDPLVAPDAGIRSRSFSVSLEEIVDDPLAKSLPGIDDVIGNAKPLCNKLGNPHLAASTLLPLSGGGHAFVFVLPHLEGNALDVIALADQQRCCNGAVHSAAHSEKNC